jgi:guanylate kinase
VFERLPQLTASISATTRQPRRGEQDGIDYHFISNEEFQRRRGTGEFLECFEVFGHGTWYGTLRSEVAPSLAGGKSVLLEIDVQGALAVLEQYPDAISIFVSPGTFEELESRLRRRDTESPEAIERRLEVAKHELTFAGRYKHQVLNDDVERAAQEISDILTSSGV